MTQYQLPRYFVAHSASADAVDDDGELLHVVDTFFVGSRHLKEREYFVVVDQFGNLRTVPGEKRGQFSEMLQNELAFNEISRNRSPRLIEANNVFLFNLQLVEQVGGVPGWNDPVYLYGTLSETVSTEKAIAGIKGQLTVTRGDLLEGLINCADDAFRYGSFAGSAGNFSQCFHITLPGDTEDEIRRGFGIVLAYPLFPPELLLTDVSNEIIISQLIYDLLSSLKEDFKREQISHPLVSTVLPVPNRLEIEQKLTSQGYLIEGERAVKKTVSGEGFKGFLASVFGALMNDDLTLPPEGTTQDFLALARETMRHLQNDYVSPRIIALKDCLKAAPAGQTNEVFVPPPIIKTPHQMPPVSIPVAPPVRLENRTKTENEPPDWMRDFIAVHRQSDAPPKITSTTNLKPPIISSESIISGQSRRDEWRNDFNTATKENSENKKSKIKPAEKPDWMKDFE